jgi:argininosuccinate lyase
MAKKPEAAKRMWGGRFSKAPAKAAEEFSRSLHFDSRLALQDLEGSVAQARALRRAGILSAREERAILGGLEQLRERVRAGRADFTTGEEDIHTWIENRLREIAGEPADKLHTGRSRNDQVALDLRLYLRGEVAAVLAGLRGLTAALVDLAERHGDQVAPGHTHFQPAQPVLLAHHLLAYVEMLLRDADRFRDALDRIAVLTTGSGALAGTSIPLDRRGMARDLGLPAISANSMDAVSDRDFAAEFVFCASLVMVHLSRLGEELIIWSHPAFGWAEIGDEYCTGSSLMPQKKNPDMAELVRGKTGRVTGHLVSLLTLLKGLPLAYNRDLQEDKEAVFDTVDTLRGALAVMTGVVGTLQFRADRLGAAAAIGFSAATDLAEYLALAGVPFRQAHGVIGRIVRSCIERGIGLEGLTLADLKGFSPAFRADALGIITAEASVRRKRGPGCTAPAQVRSALRAARRRNR